jgi:drug/metabolite transporter (DMT)-like permease
MKAARLIILTALAMIAFASNSLLCRAALRDTGIDAATFTLIRIVSGGLVLWLIVAAVRRRKSSPERDRPALRGDWISAFALFAYAAAFSFAYNTLPAGTGALVLFGTVQATMILWGFSRGERLDMIQRAGLLGAVVGLVVLLLPGLSAPSLNGSLLMLAAGVAWGAYSLRGRGGKDPVSTTAVNFLRAAPFAAVTSAIMLRQLHFDSLGTLYGVISGAITSGLGYVFWYSALSGLKATSAATVQLSVPIIAATGGILLLGEPITLRYIIASIAVLGGIALVIIERQRAQ